MKRLSLALCLAALPVAAQEPPSDHITCTGSNPGWTVRITGAVGQFELSRPINYTIPNVTVAQRREWPRAYTLLAEQDTAIVIVDEQMCVLGETEFDHSATVLTQRGTVPIVLSGCCVKDAD